MPLLKNDPLTQLSFSIHENKGVFAVLIGSGLSRSAQIPTGWEITLDLVKRIALAQGVEEQSDWAQWYRDTTMLEPNYSTLLEDIAISPNERRSILHTYIEPNEQEKEEGKKTPTPAHHAIAELVSTGHIRVIITTNFDRLMENALREHGVEPTVVSSVDSLRGAEPLTHSQCYLLKLHGDYKDSRILNTDSELESYSEEYNKILDRIIDEHGLIICGWSGEWDHALRAALFRAPNRRYPIFWSTRGELGDNAKDLATHRQAKIVAIDGADEFFRTIQQRVSILEHNQSKNPLSIELLTSSTKKYLAKHEFRIQLDDLFTEEMHRLFDNINIEKFSVQGQWSQEEFRRRVFLYESSTEALGRMVGILGRWGDGHDTQLVIDMIRSIVSNADKHQGGLVVWINLQLYPAVLILTAYAIGLTREQRWKDLHSLFMASLPKNSNTTGKIISSLFLWAWEGGGDIWKNIEGLDARKTPLSDHLLNVMKKWKNSFAGVSIDFELTFDRFETLGSLAFFEDQLNDIPNLEQLLSLNELNNNFIRIPVGRVGWNSASNRTITNELENDKLNQEILSSGFAKNNIKILSLFINNFKRIAENMYWR
ncbi:SIR2 family protein [Pectobacterium carotovorum]|uniref:SIR2 family protein n=1 Tax=Pectobacterium carotovorum TaxID=554 RepID=UPI0015DD9176|nr:SIR2 family protein [Pectobacterium carotovorum]MBA0174390.1 SIR2 family protein [Pectobacterium carotovorum]